MNNLRGDHILLAEYLIELMVTEDKQEILNGDLDFSDQLLQQITNRTSNMELQQYLLPT